MRHRFVRIDAVFSAFERCLLDDFAGLLEFLQWSFQMFALLTNFAVNILLLPILSIVPRIVLQKSQSRSGSGRLKLGRHPNPHREGGHRPKLNTSQLESRNWGLTKNLANTVQNPNQLVPTPGSVRPRRLPCCGLWPGQRSTRLMF